MARKRVAVVGSGCSGLAAFWALKTTNHEVHLFERDDRWGGHTNTVAFEHDGRKTNVDTGFIVLNAATYPNFINFLKCVEVPAVSTLMTFGVSRDQGAFEWAGTSLDSLFAQRSNLWSLRFWRMIFDIVRFNLFALDFLSTSPGIGSQAGSSSAKIQSRASVSEYENIGSYLDRNGYSKEFKDNYLIPMTAAVWSTSPDKASLEFPAMTLIRFLWNHHLLSTISARPPWKTIASGSKTYIDKVLQNVPAERLHLSRGVQSVDNCELGVQVTFEDGGQEIFDHVILATHGDTAAKIISRSASSEEHDIMKNFQTSQNTAVLHTDRDFMPKSEKAWSAWNYLTETSQSGGDVPTISLTYWMNLLQHIPTSTYGDIFVTLNPLHPPKPETVQGTWAYRHPLYTPAAVWSQEQLSRIQNRRGISYAGAWTKYGFHEDGFSSGLRVAVDHLGAKLPFEFVDSTFSRGMFPTLGLLDYVARVTVQLIHVAILFIDLVVGNLGLGKWMRRQTVALKSD